MLKYLDIKVFDYDQDVLSNFHRDTNRVAMDFRTLWANNGDSISIIYAGTGATTSSVTRKGQKSGISSLFDHGMKTISRFYLNTFDDNFKQEIIEIITN